MLHYQVHASDECLYNYQDGCNGCITPQVYIVFSCGYLINRVLNLDSSRFASVFLHLYLFFNFRWTFPFPVLYLRINHGSCQPTTSNSYISIRIRIPGHPSHRIIAEAYHVPVVSSDAVETRAVSLTAFPVRAVLQYCNVAPNHAI